MVVIGLDPGSIDFGIGILKREGGRIRYLHSSRIRLRDREFESRMKNLWNQMAAAFSSYPIDHAAIEEGFLGKNVRSMNVLSKVRGVVLGFLIHKGVPLTSYSPRLVKQFVTNNGNASKAQVNRMVKILLGIRDADLSLDESDALAVAYCHLLHHK